MIEPRIVERPAFQVVGKKTWISGQDNALFGQFWEQCRAEGLFETFKRISRFRPGAQTGGVTLGISCVEEDPANRAFYYLIAVESPDPAPDLESYAVPASRWAIFACHGPVPDAIVQSELYAFMEWLPHSSYVHAYAPEMEVYRPHCDGSDPDGSSKDTYTEFWLPIADKTP